MSAQTVQAVDVIAAGLHGLDVHTHTWAGGVNRTQQIGCERDELTWAQADERTRVIASKLATLRGATEVVTDLVNDVYDLLEQAWAMRADVSLGYESWEAYCADRFGDLGAIRLPAAERARVVMALVGVEVDKPRLSGRGAARIMAVDEQTVRADRRKAALALLPATQETEIATSGPAPVDVAIVGSAVLAGGAAPARSVVLLVLDALADLGPRGGTILEVAKRLKRGYGSVSGALSAAEAQGHVTRPDDLEQRGGYRPYVVAGLLD